MIEINAAKCLKCDTVLVSRFRHDFQTCACGDLSVDGGVDYLKRGFKDASEILELSIVREEVDFSDLTPHTIQVLLDAFKGWVTFYNEAGVDKTGLYERFVDRWVLEGNRIQGLLTVGTIESEQEAKDYVQTIL